MLAALQASFLPTFSEGLTAGENVDAFGFPSIDPRYQTSVSGREP